MTTAPVEPPPPRDTDDGDDDGDCPHEDTYVGLVNTLPYAMRVLLHCRDCGKQIVREYPFGSEGAA